MTQVNSAQRERGKSAWRKRAGGRTLAQRRADLEAQVRQHLGTEELMALTDLSQVKARLKELHRELDRKEGRRVTQYEIAEVVDVPHRTFQSWENGEVETEGRNYDKLARFYTEKLGREVTRNHILFGQEEEPEPEAQAESAPDVLGALNGATDARLRSIEDKLDRLLEAAGLTEADAVTEAAEEVALGASPEHQAPSGTGRREPSPRERRAVG